ncbi:MarR family winged helix-turn-helix transcriptional regulator [Massilia sp. GCM10020059]|uniref:MarR family transcriptional regulator n=1 Tax=Massilia agrisoli TaxID=2892444 RepID=A0ABS8IQQ7_9BURK|nr:MarR family transcriptional regulator [Massilia agrisoli]MCC6070967.1 MarR family transcriptional regulator [Massilia agrisoli]
MKQGLGTQLRHLIDLLDGDVAQQYKDGGLDYRPRYTPVMRALKQLETASIGQIAESAGITQPAATQTVNLMKKDGLVSVEPGADGRQRLVRLSRHGKDLMPELESRWAATKAAADGLDAQLTVPLSAILDEAILALEKKPFGVRISEARARLNQSSTTQKGKKT